MTTADHNVARLPLHIFEHLSLSYNEGEVRDHESAFNDMKIWKDASELRNSICQKLLTWTHQKQQQQKRSRENNKNQQFPSQTERVDYDVENYAPQNFRNFQSNASNNNNDKNKNHHAPVVITVGKLLQASSVTLIQILDPLLTYGTYMGPNEGKIGQGRMYCYLDFFRNVFRPPFSDVCRFTGIVA
jgi:hypothetical protein